MCLAAVQNLKGDCVVMDNDNCKKKALELREKLLEIEENRNHGQKGYSPEEVNEILGKVIQEMENC